MAGKERQASFFDAFSDNAKFPVGPSRKLVSLFVIAEAQANDLSLSPFQRSASLRLLGRCPDRVYAIHSLFVFLEKHPASGQVDVVIETLSRIPSPAIPEHVLKQWINYSPNLRRRFVPMLLSRDEWASQLLAAVEQGNVASVEISTSNRQHLLNRTSVRLQARASRLFAVTSTNRAAIVTQYKAISNRTSDPVRGAAVFGKICSTCHLFNGQGKNVGPNLAALTDKSASFLLTSILDPNAAVDDRFLNYTVETRDGRVVSGIFTSETASSVTVVSASEIKETVLRTEIKSTVASNLSLMPEGLEQGINLQEMADLIAYLQASPAPFSSAAAVR